MRSQLPHRDAGTVVARTVTWSRRPKMLQHFPAALTNTAQAECQASKIAPSLALGGGRVVP